MRLSLIAASLLAFAAAPAFADDASDLAAAKADIAAAKLSAASDLNMWCGAAFVMMSAKLTAGGDTANAKLASDKSDALFGKASPLLTADGVPSDKMGAISTAFTTVAYAQMLGTEPAKYTQEECETAATP
jgi:hypothetical protein